LALSLTAARRRLAAAMSEPTQAGRWPPYLLHPSAGEQGRPDAEIVQIGNWDAAMAGGTVDVVQTWPIDAVLKSLVVAAAHWYLRATSEKRRPQTTLGEMRQWITGTRSLADRLPYGGSLAEQLDRAATALERTIDWPAQYLVKVPASVETKADADLRASLNVWAMNRIVRALNETEPAYADLRLGGAEYLQVAPTAFWPAMFECLGKADLPEPPFADYKEAHKRVIRLQANVRDGQDRALMAAILYEHTRQIDASPSGEPSAH
jgi:hypothetical protein